jgi:hypothetical protein
VQTLLFKSAGAAQEKEKKREESAAAHWCFKVYSPYSIMIDGQIFSTKVFFTYFIVTNFAVH